MTYSIIQKSQLEGAKRIDAEYYCSSRTLISNFTYGKNAIDFIQYGTSEELNEEKKGFPILRLNEFNDYFINKPAKYCDSINLESFEELNLKNGDVLVCRTNGNPKLVGKSAIVLEDKNIGFASYLFRVRPTKEIINPQCLVVFLNSKIGREEIEKYLLTSNQSNFSPARLREIRIPLFNKEFQQTIANLVNKAFIDRNQSEVLYSQAEDLLLEELGLKDFKFKDDLFFVVNSSETKNRIDSDYFQPKYEQLISILRKFETRNLGELVSIKKGIEPGSEAYEEEGKLFIRVSSLSRYGIDNKDQKYLKDDLYQKLKKGFQPQIGEILLTKDASPGTAYVVKEPVEGLISGGILRLKLKEKIEPEYLALCINSIIGQMQAERDAGGSVIEHWKPEEIKNVLIPILPLSIQQKIAELVKKSHEARKKSKELLEEAKRKVEEMIEKRLVK